LLKLCRKRKKQIERTPWIAAEFVMAEIENRSESIPPSTDTQPIQDQGGARSGRERRQSSESFDGSERRSGRDRRRGFDRRAGIERRRFNDRRDGRYFRDGESVERRDVFRRRTNGK
jgi:hypothetical protein